jgi:hypothetical protein
VSAVDTLAETQTSYGNYSCIKIKNKIGAFRTDIGCEAFAAICGFISTVKKHNINSLAALLNPDLLKI